MRIFMALSFLVAVLFSTGCASHRVLENTRKPEIEINEFGTISIYGKIVERNRLLREVKRAGFSTDQEVNILIPENPDRRLMQSIAGELVQGGYKRTIFVKKKRAFSSLQKAGKGVPPPPPPRIPARTTPHRR